MDTMTTTPLLVPCPACFSMPGEPCTTPTNNGQRPVNWFHLARETAEREVQES